MIDIIVNSLIDTLKLIPFLFFAFLLIEYVEHKLNNKNKKVLNKVGKYGPLFGGLLGIIPQCGFSVMATNLYITRIISLGTLIAIYLSTSDEMIPLLLTSDVGLSNIIKILLLKFSIGVVVGFTIDLLYQKKHNINYEICDDEHCDCKHGTIKSSIKHTIKVSIFILIVNLILNIIVAYTPVDIVSKIFMKNSIFSPLLSSLIGLIPNCCSSVIITQLYINNAINLGSLIAGLLTNSGVASILLFKSNKDKKESIMILLLLYIIGTFSGILINILSI